MTMSGVTPDNVQENISLLRTSYLNKWQLAIKIITFSRVSQARTELRKEFRVACFFLFELKITGLCVFVWKSLSWTWIKSDKISLKYKVFLVKKLFNSVTRTIARLLPAFDLEFNWLNPLSFPFWKQKIFRISVGVLAALVWLFTETRFQTKTKILKLETFTVCHKQTVI